MQKFLGCPQNAEQRVAPIIRFSSKNGPQKNGHTRNPAGCHQEMTLLFPTLSLMCMANLPYHHSYAGSPQQVWFYLNHSRSLQVHNRLPFTQFILNIKYMEIISAKPTFRDCFIWQAVCSNAPELSVVGDLGKNYGRPLKGTKELQGLPL